MVECSHSFKKNTVDETVALVKILGHKMNNGCPRVDELLESMNGGKITGVKHEAIAKEFEQDKKRF